MNNNTEKNETLSPKLTSYIYLRNLISENVIRLDTKLNKAKIQKIEKIYLIKQIDKDYMNRHNIAHIVQMVKNIDTMCSFNMYQIEKSYLNIDKNRLEEHIQVLKDECREILTNNKNKNKYSGPLWLGRSNGRELEGSMVCFLHDNKRDLVEYAMILGVTEFSRKYKRVGWTEKENKDKKILFLSPIIKKEKLSVFRKKRNIPSYKKFSTMEPITL